MTKVSKPRTWQELRIPVARDLVPEVEHLLESEGALSITLTDPGDTPVLEPGVGESPLWPVVVVKALFGSDAPIDQIQARISGPNGISPAGKIAASTLADQDWERAWMADFKSMPFGHGLWIVPTNEEVPEQAETALRLDPGLAFGTGTHPTTRLCLEWIAGQNCAGKSVLDFGCGSGVLGIATALRGAERVWCIDNDPQALVATRDNAQRNGVFDKLVIGNSDENSDFAADLVVANILASTLIQLAPVLAGALSPGGRIALSGVLEHQANEVSNAFVQWVPDMKAKTLDGWVALSGVKSNRE